LTWLVRKLRAIRFGLVAVEDVERDHVSWEGISRQYSLIEQSIEQVGLASTTLGQLSPVLGRPLSLHFVLFGCRITLIGLRQPAARLKIKGIVEFAQSPPD
jgi:hypothetical protein